MIKNLHPRNGTESFTLIGEQKKKRDRSNLRQ